MKKLLTTLLFSLTFAAQAASDLASSGRAFIQDLVTVAEHSKNHAGALSSDAQEKIRKVSAQIDFNALARASWGVQWAKFRASDRVDFMAVLQELLETVVYPKAKKISADLSEMQFVSTKAHQVNVSGRVTREKRGEIISEKFQLTLIYSGNGKKVIDAIVDGEKVTANLHRQLHEALKKKTFPEIIAQMKKRVKDAKDKSDAAT